MNVYQKLMQARIQLHAMPIKKSGENTFAKYRYMELGDFLIPTQQIFASLGLCGVVSFSADIASLTITDIDTEKQIVITSPMGSAALKGCHEVQNIGAVETYQRRYLWVTAMEIVEHDAIDASAGRADTPKAPDMAAKPSTTLDAKQAADVDALIQEVGADKVAFLAWVAQIAGHDIKQIKDIPAAAMNKVVSTLEKKRKSELTTTKAPA